MHNPIIINNIDFAKKNVELTGLILLSDLARLTEVIGADSQANTEIHYHLIGVSKTLTYPTLQLNIVTKLPALCQRCLEPMSLSLILDFQYAISPSEPPELADSDDMEWLEPTKEMNLSELIEDELLMALPIAPTHQSDCAPSSAEAGKKPNPFAALKDRFK